MTLPRSLPPIGPGLPATPSAAGSWTLQPDLHLYPADAQTAAAAGLDWPDQQPAELTDPASPADEGA